MTPITSGSRLGRYEIRSKLGEGGMGEVYLAQDTKLERNVALKILPANVARDRKRMNRFIQEAKTASSLNHPNILTIFEIAEAAGTHFIATEFIDGETLRQHMQLSGAKISEALNIVIQVADALAAAHEAGVVHRDIKPDNIMLRRRDGYVKVLDFGLAKLTETEKSTIDTQAQTKALIATEPGVVMGTVQYMSPEQTRGQPLDARTDIFSLGVVLYEMLAGRAPFEGKTKSDLVASILEREPPPLARYSREVPETLEWIVTKALRKDKDERYQTAKELLTDLRSLKQRLEFAAEQARSLPPGVKSEPISAVPGGQASIETLSGQGGQTDKSGTAPPASSAEFLLSEAKRHKLGVALALSAVILLIVGVVLGLKYLGRSAPKAEPFSKVKLTRLTTNGKASEAAISPEGKYVVHVLGSAGQQSLWLRHIATGSDKEIVPTTGGRIEGATFSHDGSYIYFLREDARESVLYQVPVLGGEPKKLGADIDTVITLSPDDKRFAFLRGYPQYGENALMLANADGTGEQKLVGRKGRDFVPFVRPAWSPKADIIAAASRKPEAQGGFRTIITVGVKDGAEKIVTSQEWTSIEALEWLADGSGLVVVAADQETAPAHQIWYVAYPSGEVRRITNDTNDYHNISLTPDASSFVTVQSETVSNVWVAPDADASRATEITSNKNDGRQGLGWTPDGRIVYQSRASGNPDIWITDTDGRDQRPLTREASTDTLPVVTPDGRYIIFLSNRAGGKLNLWRMNSDGSEPMPLTSGPPDSRAQPASNNQTVFYGSSIDGKISLWRISIDGGSPARLTDYSVAGPVLSPDGKQLACAFVDVQARSYRIGILGLEGGPPIKVLDLQRYSLLQGLRWTPDGQALAYIDTRAGISNLWRLPLDGGPPKQITDFKTEQIFQFAWSRDGRWLALARGSVTSDVVLVKDSR
jgi:eukaryotic-like serine/threonine-protein kinase